MTTTFSVVDTAISIHASRFAIRLLAFASHAQTCSDLSTRDPELQRPVRAGRSASLLRCSPAWPPRGRRCPAGAHAGAVSASLRLHCAAHIWVAPQNSLRALWALRSDNCGESVYEARYARRPKCCAARRPRNRPHRAAPAARLGVTTRRTLLQQPDGGRNRHAGLSGTVMTVHACLRLQTYA